jgi:hypothetical protein
MPDLDIDEIREYLNWLADRLLADELAELQAAAGGAHALPNEAAARGEHPRGFERRAERLYVRTSIAVLRRRLTERDLGLLDPLGQLTLRRTLAELRRDYPRTDDRTWRLFLADHPELK